MSPTKASWHHNAVFFLNETRVRNLPGNTCEKPLYSLCYSLCYLGTVRTRGVLQGDSTYSPIFSNWPYLPLYSTMEPFQREEYLHTHTYKQTLLQQYYQGTLREEGMELVSIFHNLSKSNWLCCHALDLNLAQIMRDACKFSMIMHTFKDYDLAWTLKTTPPHPSPARPSPSSSHITLVSL